MSGLLDTVRGLLDEAIIAFGGRVEGDELTLLRRGLDEPLRVAVAGRIKAGKSTLVNALVGDAVAATDAGECTRVVTWYRFGHAPQVHLHTRDGTVVPVAFRHDAGALTFSLDGRRVEELDRAVVDWPSSALQAVTLIDTPGLDSARGDASADVGAAPSLDEGETSAEAVLYLLRHVQGTDIRFLESFSADGLPSPSPIHCVGVLGRADEIGVARLDAMATARRVAARYRADPRLERLCTTVVPVSGLTAMAGSTLTERDHRALLQLANADRPAVDELLLAAEAFAVQDSASPGGVSPATRRSLLDALGLWGVRLSIARLRQEPHLAAGDLARFLVLSSGIDELRAVLRDRLLPRRDLLKARAALATVIRLVGRTSGPESETLATRVEAVVAGSHELAEAALLTSLRLRDLGFSEAELVDAERLLGGRGSDPTARLGVDAGAEPIVSAAAARTDLERWQRKAEDAFTTPDGAHAARVLVRTSEQLVRSLAADPAAT